jgi:hypothetical protein
MSRHVNHPLRACVVVITLAVLAAAGAPPAPADRYPVRAPIVIVDRHGGFGWTETLVGFAGGVGAGLAAAGALRLRRAGREKSDS